MAIVAVLVLFLGTSQAALTSTQQTELLTEHNQCRSGVIPAAAPALPALTWDASLASMAQTYSAQCKWEHNANRGSNGENMYVSSATVSMDHVVGSWDSEKADYTLSSNTCAVNKTCGHYTQVVWASTTKVGCGMTQCSNIQGLSWNPPSGYIVVCNYNPAGNMGGQAPYVASGAPAPATTAAPSGACAQYGTVKVTHTGNACEITETTGNLHFVKVKCGLSQSGIGFYGGTHSVLDGCSHLESCEICSVETSTWGAWCGTPLTTTTCPSVDVEDDAVASNLFDQLFASELSNNGKGKGAGSANAANGKGSGKVTARETKPKEAKMMEVAMSFADSAEVEELIVAPELTGGNVRLPWVAVALAAVILAVLGAVTVVLRRSCVKRSVETGAASYEMLA